MLSRATSGHARQFQTFNLTAASEFQVLPRNHPLIDEPMNFYNAMPHFEDTGHDIDNIQLVHPIRISRSGPWRLYFLYVLFCKMFRVFSRIHEGRLPKNRFDGSSQTLHRNGGHRPHFLVQGATTLCSTPMPRAAPAQPAPHMQMLLTATSRTLFLGNNCLVTYSSVLKMLRLQVMIHPISCFPLADEHRGL